MNSYAYREYRFKFYLNANHFVIFNNARGETHPHTWEFTMDVLVEREKMIIFSDIEKAVDQYLDRYQNKTLNEIPPFDTVIPTLENITDYLAPQLYQIARKFGGIMLRLEGSETPTRSYIFDFSDRSVFALQQREDSEAAVSHLVDGIIEHGLEKAEK